MISLAIANYNRHDMVIESCIRVLDNPEIAEVIILDDYSDIFEFTKLWNFVQRLNTDKVLLYRNEKNYGSFLNKYKAIQKCSSDWVILLDSDNIIDNDYIEVVTGLEEDKNVIYCPEILNKLNKEGINWGYTDFADTVIDRNNIKDYVDKPHFDAWVNTGNFFLNRQQYIRVVESTEVDKELSLLDSVYFNYLWLQNGGKLQTVKGLSYVHRIHDGSYYLNNKKKFKAIGTHLKNKIKAL